MLENSPLFMGSLFHPLWASMCIILYLRITYNIYILSDITGGGYAGTAYIADLKGDSCLSNTAWRNEKYCKRIAPSLYLPVNNKGIGFIFSFK